MTTPTNTAAQRPEGLEHISGPVERVVSDLSVRVAARAVVDAARQDATGLWVITGDGELLIAALADALDRAA